jgi:rRNA-processing protein FCF1
MIDEKIVFLMPDEVCNELRSLSQRKGEKTKDRKAAQISLELSELSNFKKISLGNKMVDTGIVNFLSKNSKIILATLDRDLAARVRKQSNVKVLTIRDKKQLDIL